MSTTAPATAATVDGSATSTPRNSNTRPSSRQRNRRRGPRDNSHPNDSSTSTIPNGREGTPVEPRSHQGSSRSPRNRGSRNPQNQPRGEGAGGEPSRQGGDKPPSRPRNPRPPKAKDTPNDTTGTSSNRRTKFQGKLTNDSDAAPTPVAASQKPSEKYRTLPTGDDLTSSLTRQLSTPPYPDCPICFASIHPAQPIWSCSPSTPVVPTTPGGQVHYCWTAFHTKCVKAWAAKSVKDVAEAWRARGENDKVGDWRCPGCQAKREVVPSGYWCFCNTVPEPKLTRLATPHSCGKPCQRVRESGCGHPCTLLCHPGPCPPCQVVTHLDCYCPRRVVLSFRCGVDVIGSSGKRNLSCGNTCGRTLGCGKHKCDAICHEGDCAKCPQKEVVKCYCGKEEKEVDCGEGTPKDCFVEGEEPWVGRYACENKCDRPYDCNVHRCSKPCHPPSSKPAPCPLSPSKVTSCPCGKSTIAPPDTPSNLLSQHTFSPRPNCEAPIPTCASTCSKRHPECSHPCEAKCHTGPCPPCTVWITRPCRCGATTKRIPCYEMYDSSNAASGVIQEREILCDRPCTSLRACGRHQCRRVCCPLASLASVQKKGKKRQQVQEVGIGEERGGLHECDLVCGRMLGCGNHACEERDHRGPCPPCLRSSFEEMFCPCGRTVLEPPIPCGTRIQCSYPCPRGPPPCGHPVTPHSCHDESQPCPPCPHLTTKQCACGKKEMTNVKCSLEKDKVSCGTVCGKLMSCGFHHCDSLCHSGPCGTCKAPCGKSRKLCLPQHHPCTLPCHAPASCSEAEPCDAIITITCPCGRMKQNVKCGKRTGQPAGNTASVHAPKCTNECSIAKRNARLAEALGIDPAARADAAMARVVYPDETVAFARANPRFLGVVEKAFADFINGPERKKTQVLPHMPVEKRKFVCELAGVYRMDTQLVDQEPQRSVQVIRRVDTRVPGQTLSAYIAGLAPNFGKLAVRSLGSTSGSSTPVPSGGSTAVSRGWGASGSGSGTSTPVPSQHSVRPAGFGTAVVGTVPPFVASSASSTSTPAPSSAGVWRPPSLARNAARAQQQQAAIVPAQEEQGPVADNWEDDL